MKHETEPLKLIISIVQRGQGNEMMRILNARQLIYHWQLSGHGTAPSDMLEMLGLSGNEKDVVISLGLRSAVDRAMTAFGEALGSFGRVRGLVCSVPVTGVNQLIAATLAAKNNLSEETAMEQTAREQKHSLILITVNQGYTDEVMETAKKAGAMGGTILRARWKGEEHLEQFYGITVQSEKEIIAILAANTQRNQIMEQVNSKHGLHSEAHSVIVSVPVDRVFKLG